MKILLPVDGSNGALAAVHQTLRLIRAGLVAEVLLVNVQEPPSLYEVVVAHDADVLDTISEEAAGHALAQAEALLGAAGVRSETRTGRGDPGHLLVDIAEEAGCDLIVIGAHGQDGSAGGTPGPVAGWLVGHSALPVLVVPSAADAGG